jgi:transposase-like protein
MSGTRRKFYSAFRVKGAIKAIKERNMISELAQEFEVHPNQVSQWKRGFLERSAQVFEVDKRQAQEFERLEQELKVATSALTTLPPRASSVIKLGLLP